MSRFRPIAGTEYEYRRQSHNDVERRRRENISANIGRLAELVPACHQGDTKPSKLNKGMFAGEGAHELDASLAQLCGVVSAQTTTMAGMANSGVPSLSLAVAGAVLQHAVEYIADLTITHRQLLRLQESQLVCWWRRTARARPMPRTVGVKKAIHVTSGKERPRLACCCILLPAVAPNP
jgi:hypothetical protein